MASGPRLGQDYSLESDGSRENYKWDAGKVYTRKCFKGVKKNVKNSSNVTINSNTIRVSDNDSINRNGNVALPITDILVSEDVNLSHELLNNLNGAPDSFTSNTGTLSVQNPCKPPDETDILSRKQLSSEADVVVEDTSTLNPSLTTISEPLNLPDGNKDLSQKLLSSRVEASCDDLPSHNHLPIVMLDPLDPPSENDHLSQKLPSDYVNVVYADSPNRNMNLSENVLSDLPSSASVDTPTCKPPLIVVVNTSRNENLYQEQISTQVNMVPDDSLNSNTLPTVVMHSSDPPDKNFYFSQKPLSSHVDEVSDFLPSPNHEPIVDPPFRNGAVNLGPRMIEDQTKFGLSLRLKQEKRELRRKFENELHTIRNMMKMIEAKEGQSNTGFRQLCSSAPSYDIVHNRLLKRVHSDVVSVPSFQAIRPFHNLNVSVNHNRQSDYLEKEKRTPKENQFYRNSEFLLAKDKFPPAESNKKSKFNSKKHGGSELGFGIGKFFKSCGVLLQRLMKHKHGWVFNTPVDVNSLGLHDYFMIIQHPMDLGTVKTRLSKNWYKSPREFAEDVRLTFHNAMTYNPKGQDVHTMAEQLLQIFEDRWSIIQAHYIGELKFAVDYEVGFHTSFSPTSRITNASLLPPSLLDSRRVFDRSASMTHCVEPKLKPTSFIPPTRTAAPKKPKAKDPHKRDMTYDEKQKLSTNLQNLPSEKLDLIVQIIKKRNSALFQHDDEIEVDIDAVDAETLWELDRFVTNHKKFLSKKKRKAEIALQARLEREKNPNAVVMELPTQNIAGVQNVSQSVQEANPVNNDSGSSSSSSSSSDSGSSSSDSDSDSSSDGSDAGR